MSGRRRKVPQLDALAEVRKALRVLRRLERSIVQAERDVGAVLAEQG